MTASWGPIFTRQERRQAAKFFKNLLMGDWPILCGREQAFKGPPRTSQRIAARQSLTAKKILFKDPEVLLAAELGF